MSCLVESVEPGKDDDLYWYCCNCKDGPMSLKLSPVCTNCCIHKRCSPVTSAASLSSDHRKEPSIVSEVSRIPNASQIALGTIKTPSSLCSEDLFDPSEAPISETEDSSSEDDLLQLSNDGHQSFDADVQSHTHTILSLSKQLSSSIRYASTPGHQSHPSGCENTNYTPGKISNGQRGNYRKKSNLGNGRKGFTDRKDENGSDGERRHKQQSKKRRGETRDAEAGPYACFFLKNNPHRHRHNDSCRGGYSISGLKEHLVRKGSPHELNLDEDHQAFQYPVEGVGFELRKTIRRTKCGSNGGDPFAEGKVWWERIYALLFGSGVEMPSCRYDENDIARSNDMGLQENYRVLLVHTLKRHPLESEISQKYLATVVKHHFRSILEAEVHRLQTIFPREDTYRLVQDILARPMDVIPSRRKLHDIDHRQIASTQQPESDIPPTQEDIECPTSASLGADELFQTYTVHANNRPDEGHGDNNSPIGNPMNYEADLHDCSGSFTGEDFMDFEPNIPLGSTFSMGCFNNDHTMPFMDTNSNLSLESIMVDTTSGHLTPTIDAYIPMPTMSALGNTDDFSLSPLRDSTIPEYTLLMGGDHKRERMTEHISEAQDHTMQLPHTPPGTNYSNPFRTSGSQMAPAYGYEEDLPFGTNWKEEELDVYFLDNSNQSWDPPL